MTIADLSEEKVDAIELQVDRILAERTFGHFLDWVRVKDPPPGLGIRPFIKWEYTQKISEVLSWAKFVVWLKARQIGATTELAAFSRWKSYPPYSEVMLFSQGEMEAQDFLDKAKTIEDQLPDHLKLGSPRDNLSVVTFSNHSRIRALPTTQRAGRSTTASLVILDEADFMDYLDDLLGAVMPTINDGDRQLIMISTRNKLKTNSKFQQIYKEGVSIDEAIALKKAGKWDNSKFVRIFYGWDARPDRGADWYKAQKDASEAAGTSSDFPFEYPGSEREALSPPAALRTFDAKRLSYNETMTREPLEVVGGSAKIFKYYVPGRKYSAGSDTGHGVGKDYSVTAIIDLKSGEVVADIMDNLIAPPAFSNLSMKLLEKYKNPTWVIETNDQGQEVYNIAKDDNYKRLYRSETKRGKVDGWRSSEYNRWELWGELKKMFNTGNLTVLNAEGLAQFVDVIRNPKNRGRDEASSGANDDYPTACGLALQVKYASYTNSGEAIQMPTLW